MSLHSIECLDELPESAEERIHQGHVSDEAADGIVCNYKKFSLAAKNKHGEILGALTAFTAFSELYVEDIWIEPQYRKKGLGKALLEDLENRFKNSGYNNINLVTSQFQAPKFYKKCGFELEFVRINKYNPKLTKYFFIKYFEQKQQDQGVLAT